MSDVIANRLAFFHELNASANLEYYQTLRITDGAHTIKPVCLNLTHLPSTIYVYVCMYTVSVCSEVFN